jgi:hypothetical protein
LQGNKISRISGLSSLVHLSSLSLASNRISDYKELQRLASLPSLVEVSFRDVHFGDCPVCLLDGYRNSVLIWLKQLRVLDGVEVTSDDRDSAQDAYLQKVFQFNQRVEELQREHEREMHGIEQRRKRIVAHSDVLTSEMMAAFDGLESLVSSGREQIAAEHRRQMRVRNENASALAAALATLGRLHSVEVERRIAEEKQAARDEERLLLVLESRAIAEKAQAGVIAAMHYGDGDALGDGPGGARACALLSDHAPSFQLLARHFRQAQAFARHTDSNGRLLHILRAYQLLSSTLAETFADHSTGIADQRAGLSPQKTVQQRFYWCGSSAEQSAVVTAGFSALQSPSRGEEWVVLHSDPALALALLPLGDDTFPSTAVPAVPFDSGNDGSSSARSGDGTDRSPRRRAAAAGMAPPTSAPPGSAGSGTELGSVGLVLAVTCALDSSLVEAAQVRRRPTSVEDIAPFLAQAKSLQNVALEVRYDISSDLQNGGSRNDGDEEESDNRTDHDDGKVLGQGAILLVPPALQKKLTPDAHILCASGALGGDLRRIETVLDDLSRKQGVDVITRSDAVASGLLDQLEGRIEEEVTPLLP